MRIPQEENLDPVVTSIPFKTEAEALAIPNDTQNGVTGYLWTYNLIRALPFTETLEVGMIWVYSENIRHLSTPFGRVKASDIGRDRRDRSSEVYMEQKNIAFATGQSKMTKLGVL